MTWRVLGSNPAFDRALGVAATTTPRIVPRTAWAPRVRRLRAPLEDARAIVARLDGVKIAASPRLPLELRARYGAVAAHEKKQAGYHGPRCCLETTREVERKLDHLPLPHEFECATCKTVWVIEMQMVEVYDGAR